MHADCLHLDPTPTSLRRQDFDRLGPMRTFKDSSLGQLVQDVVGGHNAPYGASEKKWARFVLSALSKTQRAMLARVLLGRTIRPVRQFSKCQNWHRFSKRSRQASAWAVTRRGSRSRRLTLCLDLLSPAWMAKASLEFA